VSEGRIAALGESPVRGWRAAAVWLALAPAAVQALPLFWKTPLSHDHPTHLFKAWHFWTEMLGQWRLRGWSHFWGFGFPSDEFVPSGGELWVSLFRALSLGQLSWLRTYALAFAAFLLFKAFTAFVFTRRYFGLTAAVIAAWLTSLDAGAFSEGGWLWNVEWGVWPVSLAMCFLLLALVQLSAVLRTGRARHVLRAGLWSAAALLTHQIALLALAGVVPLLLLGQCSRERPLPPLRLAQTLGAALLGFALPATTLLPFLARSHYTMDLGDATQSLVQVTARLLELRTFANVPPLVHGLGLLGGWFVLRGGPRRTRFIALSAIAFLVMSSDLLTGVLHLERVLPSLIKIESARCLLVAKLFWYPLAGHACVELARRLRPLWSRWARGRTVPAALVTLGAAATLMGSTLPHWYAAESQKQIQGEAETAFYADLQQVWAWSRELHAQHAGHFRIAYYMPHGDHLATLAPVFDQTLLYKIGVTPTQIFDGLPLNDGRDILKALSIEYVVSFKPLEAPLFELERSFGSLRLYRFADYDPDPFDVLGPGHGELLEFAPERVRIRLSEMGPWSRLRIHVGAMDRWQAEIAGTVVPISTVPAQGVEDPVLMEVPARDGELLLRYVYRWSDWLGLLVTLGALPAFWVLTRWGPRPWQALFSELERRRRPLLWLALAGGVLLAGMLILRTRNNHRLLPPRSLFYDGLPLTLGGHPCSKISPLGYGCGIQRVEAALVHGRGDHLCMTSTSREPLRVQIPGKLGAFLVAQYDALGAPGSIRAELDGNPLGQAHTRPAYMLRQTLQFDTRARSGTEGDLQVVLEGGPLACFDLWWR
jgi:hypothetical protein